MASKKAGRLAGLATLAGLAYMNKDKLFGAKGETKAAETKAETKAETTDTAAENNRIADARAAREEDKSTALFMSGDDERPAPTGMGAATKFATRPKAPSVPVTKAPIIKNVGGGRSGGRGGPEAGEAAAYQSAKDAEQAKLMSSYKPRRPDTRIEDAELKDNTGKRIKRYEDDGGMSMAARQNVAAEDEGLKRGGKVKKMASGGMTSSASKRADGIASKGKTRGRMC